MDEEELFAGSDEDGDLGGKVASSGMAVRSDVLGGGVFMLHLRQSLQSEFGVVVVLLLFLSSWLFRVSRHLCDFLLRQCLVDGS